MKFLRVKPFSGAQMADVIRYLRTDLHKVFSDLVEGLRHLRFEDNLDSFTAEVSLTSGATATIPNQLGTPVLKWWPVRITGDNRLVEGGDFTERLIFIKNAGGTTVTATLLFVR